MAEKKGLLDFFVRLSTDDDFHTICKSRADDVINADYQDITPEQLSTLVSLGKKVGEQNNNIKPGINMLVIDMMKEFKAQYQSKQ